MYRKYLLFLVILFSGALLFAQSQIPPAGPAVPGTEQGAQTGQAPEVQESELGAGMMGQEVSLQSVQGYNIQNTDGSIKGKVVDAIVSEDGSIAYTVVEFDQPQELMGSRYLIPPQVTKVDVATEMGTFDVTSEDIAGLPTFDAEQLTMEGTEWKTQADSYWQNKLGAEYAAAEIMNPVLASELMQFQIVGRDGEQLGQIQDLMIDSSSFEIASIKYSGDAGLGAGEQTASIDEAEINVDERQIVLAADTLGVEPATPEATTPDTTIPAPTEPAVPEATPPTVPEPAEPTAPAVPEATPPATPEATPPAVPEATPPTTPEATPPAVPEATPPTTPEATPPTTPGTGGTSGS